MGSVPGAIAGTKVSEEEHDDDDGYVDDQRKASV